MHGIVLVDTFEQPSPTSQQQVDHTSSMKRDGRDKGERGWSTKDNCLLEVAHP